MTDAEITFSHASGKDVRTLPAAFQQTVKMRPSEVAIRTTGDTATVTWSEYGEKVRKIAAGLAALGVKRGDTVGVMMTNRPEFHLVDTAALHLGATPFSIYNTSSPEQINYLFSNAGNNVAITEQALFDKVKVAGADIEHFVVVDGEADGALTFDELLAKGEESFDFDATWQAVEQSDVATLIYTSGTTGPPKGVELTHGNLIAEFNSIADLVNMQADDRITSYLPHAHVADRVTSHYANMIMGVQVTDVADPRAIAQALPDARPTVWLGVPRVWQKIKAGIEAKLASEATGVKQKLAYWAIETGAKAAKEKLAGRTPSTALGIQHKLADKLVLSKLRHALGMDELRHGITGAAAIPVETLEFFWGLGIPVFEVWGMSENCGGATSNLPGAIKVGTVGKALKGVEVVLADDGELLIRGNVVMRGYRKQPDKTAEAIDADGWLHTGDIGTIDSEGFVKIVDRKKELIINEAGKNMSPTNIENAVKAQSPLVGQVVCIGDARPYNTALVVLDPEVVEASKEKLGLSDTSPAAVAENAKVRGAITQAVKAGNAKLSRVEQIKRFTIIASPWEPGGDELTPTMKLKRKPISEKYASEIASLYEKSPAPTVIDLG